MQTLKITIKCYCHETDALFKIWIIRPTLAKGELPLPSFNYIDQISSDHKGI